MNIGRFNQKQMSKRTKATVRIAAGTIIACVVVMFSTGCSTTGATGKYSSPKLPDTQLAIVHGCKVNHPRKSLWELPHTEFVHIESVDDILLGYYPLEVRMLPGKRRLQVFHWDSRSNRGILGALLDMKAAKRHSLDLEAQAAHQYKIGFNSDGHKLIGDGIWIEDIASGEVVSGKKQSK